MRFAVLVAFVVAGWVTPAGAQWTNRYPKVQGYSHHVYLEGYEFPTMNVGPTDPAPSPDGRSVAFSARGWLWVLDLGTGTARRVTAGGAMDFRPAWSPSGDRLAFIRDDTRDTRIVVRDLASGRETEINTPAIELDPVFAADGNAVLYSSASAGDLDLWRHDLATGQSAPVTDGRGIELAPRLSRDGGALVYLAKGGGDRIVHRDLVTGEETTLASERITSMTRPALSPDGKEVAYTWPTQREYELRLLRTEEPGTSLLLTTAGGLPLSPAWSADGAWVWFTEADDVQTMRLRRIARAGGPVVDVPVRVWEWGVPTGRVRIVTTTAERQGGREAARVSVVDADGHPGIPAGTQARFDGQTGRVFFYSPGVIEVEVPAGRVRVAAVQGLATPEVSATVEVPPGGTREVTLTLEPVWDARAAGWLSGDHHFHLNYGGPYQLTPDAFFPMMAGEALDVATPMLANLHNRFEDQHLWGWEHGGRLPLVQFTQEVRSHFLGHVGLLNIRELFWPWIWGPGYQVYARDDRPNAEPLAHARRQGGLGVYVHPYVGRTPFAADGAWRIPIQLLVDGVLGNMDLLEVACLWSDELGTSEVWYRLLNLGVPIAPSAGTDVMNNFYRTMAIGTTRAYVRTGGATSWQAYYDGLRAGRSFVTTGPLLDFTVDGAGPGEVVRGGREARWALTLRSAVAVDTVEVLVNGRVVWSGAGVTEPGTRTFSGSVRLPAGGWIAARARGGTTVWPAMDSYPFAHTGATWIGRVGSTDPAARRQAAAELLEALAVAEQRFRSGYEGMETPNIDATFRAARGKLEGARN